jgi:hypothetical protein
LGADLTEHVSLLDALFGTHMSFPASVPAGRTALAIGTAALLILAALAGTATLYLRGSIGAEVLSDLPSNEEKLRAMSLPARAPGPGGPGGPPTVLVLGSSHLAQDDRPVGPTQQKRIADALAAFDPDMLVVEKLPPDWPQGRGGDYRPEFDMQAYSDRWTLPLDRAPAVIDSLGGRSGLSPGGHCRLGKAYFLTWALAKAAFQWTATDCPATEGEGRLGRWFRNQLRHEMVQVGFPVARRSGTEHVVPFDYRGPDVPWAIGDSLRVGRRERDLGALRDYVRLLRSRQVSRAYHEAGSGTSLVQDYRYLNSPEWIGLQYWTYEQVYPRIDYREAGPLQRRRYWRRNRKMLGEMNEAVTRHDPDRILVVVGAGHKYFLDVLIRRAGYSWVDPRDYLPEARSE